MTNTKLYIEEFLINQIIFEKRKAKFESNYDIFSILYNF